MANIYKITTNKVAAHSAPTHYEPFLRRTSFSSLMDYYGANSVPRNDETPSAYLPQNGWITHNGRTWNRHTRGMVLITTMLILLVVSLLATSLVKTSLMAKNIHVLSQNKSKAFDLAVNKLQAIELNPTNEPYEDNTGQVATNIKLIDSGVCGINFYKIRVVTNYAGMTSEVQSVWAEPNSHYSTCKIKIRPGRQSFLIIR